MENINFAIKNINVDLHIHSYASFYKDGEIVKLSNKDNTHTLIEALENNNINMFAITDHNRFDYELYCQFKKEIQDNNIIKKILPGIEFDVILENSYPKCHIITIFDDSDDEKLEKITEKISNYKELKKEESYTIGEFENLLKKIGLKTILIVHQKQSLDNRTGKTDSLSAACEDPSYFIKTGYIDSLEYGSNKSEGIVKNSLRNLNINFPLITGSDCHEWSAYPYRDLKSKKIERKFPSFKCLPTFKGLLMSISSFGSRANRNINTNLKYIKKITINNSEYPLANGINAIIGDNGSGKSLLLNLLCGGNKKYYENIVKINKLSFEYNTNLFQEEEINYIRQGEINEKVRDGNLFDNNSEFYDNINTKALFSENIMNYFDDINKYVMKEIKKAEEKEKLKNNTIEITAINWNFYLPVIDAKISLEDVSVDKERTESIKLKLNELKNELEKNKQYYEKFSLVNLFQTAINQLQKIYDFLNKNLKRKENRNKAKSIISSKLREYETSLVTRRTSQESFNEKILKEYQFFKSSLVDFIKLNNEKNLFPEFPKKISGISSKQINDYIFMKKTDYNNVYLKEEFYKHCFNSKYSSEEEIKSIFSRDNYKEALKGCTSLQDLEKFKEKKVKDFVELWSKENTFISEVSSEETVGNTPGEIALVYYKYLIQEKENDFCVLAIDQPEDDINPNRIRKYLLNILSSIRDKKQVLIVTHNPLLVVNLDVDNVVFLSKSNDNISIKYGALEYDKDYNILNLIKENLDGGYKAIEGRLKKYERDED